MEKIREEREKEYAERMKERIERLREEAERRKHRYEHMFGEVRIGLSLTWLSLCAFVSTRAASLASSLACMSQRQSAPPSFRRLNIGASATQAQLLLFGGYATALISR